MVVEFLTTTPINPSHLNIPNQNRCSQDQENQTDNESLQVQQPQIYEVSIVEPEQIQTNEQSSFSQSRDLKDECATVPMLTGVQRQVIKRNTG